MFRPDVMKWVLPVPVDSSSIDEYIVSGGYNTLLRKKQIKFFESSKKKIKKDFYEHSKSWNPKNKSYVYKFELIFSIDGELVSHHYVGRSGTDESLFGDRFLIHFKNMINRTEGKEVEDSPSFEKSKDHLEKCKLVCLVVYIDPVTKDAHIVREDELIKAHISEYRTEFIENKQGSSSGKPSLWTGARIEGQRQRMKKTSIARGHSRPGQNKGRKKSSEETTKIRNAARGVYNDRMYKITEEDGTETRLHRVDSKKKLGVTPEHLHRIASRMTLGYPKYDESYKMGPKQKGPQGDAHHKLWNKGIVKVEFGGKSGSLKKPFYLKHKDTGEITFYKSIADGLKKIKYVDDKPICKTVLRKIVNGHIHGDDVGYFPYTLFIKDKD